MKKKDKIYLVYHSDKDSGIESHLYGYTNEKDIIHQFIEERNMDIFEIIKAPFNIQEYKKFLINHPNNRLVRSNYYTTGVNPITDMYILDTISLITTVEEDFKTVLEGDNYICQHFDRLKKWINYLDEDILDDIEHLGYDVYKDADELFDGFERFSEEDIYMNSLNNKHVSYSNKNIQIDQFKVFISLYGRTLKPNN